MSCNHQNWVDYRIFHVLHGHICRFIYVRKQERYDGEKVGKNSNRPVGSIEAVKEYSCIFLPKDE